MTEVTAARIAAMNVVLATNGVAYDEDAIPKAKYIKIVRLIAKKQPPEFSGLSERQILSWVTREIGPRRREAKWKAIDEAQKRHMILLNSVDKEAFTRELASVQWLLKETQGRITHLQSLLATQ